MSRSRPRVAPIAPAGVVLYNTEFGTGWVACDGTGAVVAMGLPGSAAPPGNSNPPPALERFAADLEGFWTGGALPAAGSRLIRRAASTPFVCRVYEIVARIPRGKTMTYGDVATAAGRPGAARAVGAAMARNPFAPVIPCHRVVGSDGRLTGYGGGLDMKRRLLEMERCNG